MQAKSENFSEFSERTEVLSRRLHLNVSDLPEKISISASMFHAYRSGKYPISPKAWRKLELAERAAGLGVGAAVLEKEEESSSGRLGEIRAQLASLQAEISTLGDFSYSDLQSRLQSAGALPVSPQDARLTPAQLWAKYPPA
jgi:hypothetical protein